MQAPTHLATGVFIDKVVPDVQPRFIRTVLIVVLSLFSHSWLDAVSRLTYHPPESSPHDPFWLSYHTGLSVLTVVFARKNQKEHKLAMICSVLPDLEWFLIRIPARLGIRVPFWRRPLLHELQSRVLYAFAPFRRLQRLPNLKQKKVAATSEFAVLILLIWLIHSIHGPSVDRKEKTGPSLRPSFLSWLPMVFSTSRRPARRA